MYAVSVEILFSCKATLKIHKMTYIGEKPYQCSECDMSFSQLDILMVHIGTHYNELFKCPQCEEVFSTFKDVNLHRKSHIEITYKCHHCEMFFFKIDHLKNHMIFHTNEKIFECSLCEEVFSTNKYDELHKESNIEVSYKCHHCEMIFFKNDHLKKHMAIHTCDKLYKCTQCDTDFPTNTDVELHRKSHIIERSYKCNQCEMAFTQKVHLKNHMIIHTHEELYKCSKCSKTFSDNDGFKRHMRNHSEKKSYQCNHCDKSFDYNRDLLRHMNKNILKHMRIKKNKLINTSSLVSSVSMKSYSETSNSKNLKVQAAEKELDGSKIALRTSLFEENNSKSNIISETNSYCEPQIEINRDQLDLEDSVADSIANPNTKIMKEQFPIANNEVDDLNKLEIELKEEQLCNSSTASLNEPKVRTEKEQVYSEHDDISNMKSMDEAYLAFTNLW